MGQIGQWLLQGAYRQESDNEPHTPHLARRTLGMGILGGKRFGSKGDGPQSPDEADVGV